MDNFRKRGQLTSMVIKVSVKKHVANFSITSDYDFTKFRYSYTEIVCLNGASKGTKIKVKNESNDDRSDCQIKIDTVDYHYTVLGKPRQRPNYRFSVRTLSLSNGIIFFRVRFGVELIRPTPVDNHMRKPLVSANAENANLRHIVESQRNLITKLQRQIATYATVPPAVPLLQALASSPIQPTVQDCDLMLRAFAKNLGPRVHHQKVAEWLAQENVLNEMEKNVDEIIDRIDEIPSRNLRNDMKTSLCIDQNLNYADAETATHSKTKKPP